MLLSPCLSTSSLSTPYFLFFFFNDTATTEIYTLSLHDALPISRDQPSVATATDTQRAGPTSVATGRAAPSDAPEESYRRIETIDRKSTRLNSSHMSISYAVFCLKKKKKKKNTRYSDRKKKRTMK